MTIATTIVTTAVRPVPDRDDRDYDDRPRRRRSDRDDRDYDRDDRRSDRRRGSRRDDRNPRYAADENYDEYRADREERSERPRRRVRRDFDPVRRLTSSHGFFAAKPIGNLTEKPTP